MPVWAVRSISRLYAASDALGELVLPLGTRVILAIAIAGGTGFAMWPVPFTGELVTAPWWTLLLCWALLLGLGTRPVALILCALAPPIVLSAGIPDRFEVTLLLLLIAAKGAGKLSLDGAASCWAGSYLRMPDRRDEPVPHVVVVGGGFGGIAAVRGLRWTHAESRSSTDAIIICSSRSCTRLRPLPCRRPISRCLSAVSCETSAT